MNYEKAYKEALERAKYLKENTDSVGAKDISYTFEYIFPELKESEDEKIRKALIKSFEIHDLKALIIPGFSAKDVIAWLEKQSDQKHVEQDTEINDLWVYIREWNDKFGRLPKDEDELAACIDYVIKRQKPASWSEEDERILNRIQQILEFYDRNYAFIPTAMPKSEMPKYVDWLKSLKPQNRWKPSEKQLSVLQTAIKDYGICAEKSVLESLYNDLKKL